MFPIESDKSFIREVSLERGIPIVDLMLSVLDKISEESNESITLLAVCPNSIWIT